MATRWKGDGAGIFISIHANALPSRSVRGVETYFLSEARTDHERRVAALENAPLALERGPSGPAAGDPDLDFIINELRNSDSQHWSAELAELVQTDLARVHPGPDRGVKQAPFAVITNAIMPAVLVETGFITNPQEERALGDTTFQKKAAGAIARAVVEFFERYPPGQVETSRGGR
jgi:N-acetylmuramoyl-L-alanine amidase